MKGCVKNLLEEAAKVSLLHFQRTVKEQCQGEDIPDFTELVDVWIAAFADGAGWVISHIDEIHDAINAP